MVFLKLSVRRLSAEITHTQLTHFTQFLADIISDCILVGIPIQLLWGINIRAHDRRLLMAIFSASILTTLISGFHCYYILSDINVTVEAILADLEVSVVIQVTFSSFVTTQLTFCSGNKASIALIICNLAILVAWLRRSIHSFHYGDPIDPSPGSTSNKGDDKPEPNSVFQLTSTHWVPGSSAFISADTHQHHRKDDEESCNHSRDGIEEGNKLTPGGSSSGSTTSSGNERSM